MGWLATHVMRTDVEPSRPSSVGARYGGVAPSGTACVVYTPPTIARSDSPCADVADTSTVKLRPAARLPTTEAVVGALTCRVTQPAQQLEPRETDHRHT